MPLPTMVGRDAELALLRNLLDAATSGCGSVLLVAGEAGIGKSRLLQEAGELARRRGLSVLRGRAVESGGTYRPVAQALLSSLRGSRLGASEELRPYRVALGRLLPDWFEVPADAGGSSGTVDQALVLGEGLLRLLLSIGGAAGCLLILEDLHWADADTLALVEYLAGAVRDSPVLVAASARDDWPGAGVDRLLRAEDVTTLRLTRLSPEEVGALAAARRGAEVPEPIRRLLVDRSDGVPFLVVELLAGLAEREGSFDAGVDDLRTASMPRTFADLVAHRPALLTTDQQRFLAAAAVLGTDPDWSLLCRVSKVGEAEALTALRGAAAVHLLDTDDGRLRWRHALTRDAVLAALLPPEHAALARAAAQALQARGGPDDEATAAELLIAAGEHDAAAAVLPRATALLDQGVGRLVGHASAAPLPQFGLWVLLRTVTSDRDAMARDSLRGLPVARRPANRGALHYAHAVADGRGGRSREAAERFTAGDDTLSQLPWLRSLLRLFALEAAVVDGWGDPVPALRADLAEHERTGELQLARTCRDLLRRAGVPTRRGRGESVVPPGMRAVGVTSRELDVLTQLVSGRTNTQIAARLYLSPRTVETHVTNLLGKTGTVNRAELRAWALAQTP